MIELIKNTIVINTQTATTLQISLTKTGASLGEVSANILFSGADIFYPSAQQYNGIKASVVWLDGEEGEKIASIPLEGISASDQYLLVTIDDCLGDTVGIGDRAYVLLTKNEVIDPTNKFLPLENGDYVNVITVDGDNPFSSSYINTADLVPEFTPNTDTESGDGGTVPPPPFTEDPYIPSILTDKGWSSIPEVITAPPDSGDLKVANTEFVSEALSRLDQKFTNLTDNFTANTADAAGTSGTVPPPFLGSDPEVLTNLGWSSTPQVPTPGVGASDLTIPNIKFVRDSLSVLDTKFTDLTKVFTPNTSTSPGTGGIVPPPPTGDNEVLTNLGWSDSPKVAMAEDGDASLTVANTSFVSRGLDWLDQKFTALTNVFTANTETTAGTAGIVPAPPATPLPEIPNLLVLTSGGWNQPSIIGSNQAGMGVEWVGTELPEGSWLWQDGSFYEPSEHPNLFAVIAYSRGQSGNKFQVPNKPGYIIKN